MSEMDAMGAFGALLAIGAIAYVVSAVISLAITVFYVIVNWKLYVKMGEEGWVSIVPLYNTWVFCEKVVGHGAKMFFMFIPLFGQLIYPLVLIYKLHKAMGKSTGFAILGLSFSGITLPIMAFGDATYIGPH